MATFTWITGFEHGLAAPVTTGGGICNGMAGTAVAVNAASKRTGNYGLHITPTTTATSIAKTVVGSPEYVVARAYVRFVSFPTVGGAIFWQTNAGGNFSISINATSKKLYVVVGSTTGSAVANACALDTWYRLDFRAYCGGTTWTMDWQIDGVDQTQVSEGSHSASNFAAALTRVGTGAAATMDAYFDDIARSETSADYPIGEGFVVGLRPNADGTHNAGTNVMEDEDGNDIHATNFPAYAKLDEDPWITTANDDLVRCAADTGGDDYYAEVQFADTTENTIKGAGALLQWASASTAANLAACAVYDSDAQMTVVYGDPTGTRADYSQTSAYYTDKVITAPAGGWTKAYVNSLIARVGYCTDGNPDPYWLALMLEVECTTTPPVTWIPKVIMVS